jgi:hypothetical protein
LGSIDKELARRYLKDIFLVLHERSDTESEATQTKPARGGKVPSNADTTAVIEIVSHQFGELMAYEPSEANAKVNEGGDLLFGLSFNNIPVPFQTIVVGHDKSNTRRSNKPHTSTCALGTIHLPKECGKSFFVERNPLSGHEVEQPGELSYVGAAVQHPDPGLDGVAVLHIVHLAPLRSVNFPGEVWVAVE